ncbi:MAG: branched-chain amino acid aminotransferase [Bacillus sp. (in: firmicutes)]
MIIKKVTNYIDDREAQGNNQLDVTQKVYEVMEENQLLEGRSFTVNILSTEDLYRDAYAETGDKETEEILSEKNTSFFMEPISYFKERMNEFMYVESPHFDLIGVEAVSFEVDDVFGTYEALLGLKVPKKWEKELKSHFTDLIDSGKGRYSLSFSQNDGLWDVNFTVEAIEGFNENWTIGEAYSFIYDILFDLITAIQAR